MNIYKTLYISIIWLLLFLFISLVFLIMGIRLPKFPHFRPTGKPDYFTAMADVWSTMPVEKKKRYTVNIRGRYSLLRDRKPLGWLQWQGKVGRATETATWWLRFPAARRVSFHPMPILILPLPPRWMRASLLPGLCKRREEGRWQWISLFPDQAPDGMWLRRQLWVRSYKRRVLQIRECFFRMAPCQLNCHCRLSAR